MRSEGVVVVLLQKAKMAKRIYAGVLNTGSNADGYKDEGITFPSQEMQISLFRQVQEEVGVKSTDLSFMEAHGSATKVSSAQPPKKPNKICNQIKMSKLTLETAKLSQTIVNRPLIFYRWATVKKSAQSSKYSAKGGLLHF